MPAMRRTLLTTAFWLDALERAVKTAAQSAMLVLGADKLDVVSTEWTTWSTVLGFAAGGALLSVLTSVASAPVAGVSPASALPTHEGA